MHRRRIELALSQENVAYAAGLTRSHFQQLERGRSGQDRAANPSLRTLLALCEALDLTLDELLPSEYPGVSSRLGAA